MRAAGPAPTCFATSFATQSALHTWTRATTHSIGCSSVPLATAAQGNVIHSSNCAGAAMPALLHSLSGPPCAASRTKPRARCTARLTTHLCHLLHAMSQPALPPLSPQLLAWRSELDDVRASKHTPCANILAILTHSPAAAARTAQRAGRGTRPGCPSRAAAQRRHTGAPHQQDGRGRCARGRDGADAAGAPDGAATFSHSVPHSLLQRRGGCMRSWWCCACARAPRAPDGCLCNAQGWEGVGAAGVKLKRHQVRITRGLHVQIPVVQEAVCSEGLWRWRAREQCRARCSRAGRKGAEAGSHLTPSATPPLASLTKQPIPRPPPCPSRSCWQTTWCSRRSSPSPCTTRTP